MHFETTVNEIFQFQDILKPAYNSIDMMEVELLDDDRSPRDFNTNLVMVNFIGNFR